VDDLRPSTSAFVVFLGVDYVPDVEPITMLAAGGRQIGIAIPSKVDPSLAPRGHSSVSLITLMPPAPDGAWNRKTPGYAAKKRSLGDALIAEAEQALPGLRGHIVYRQEGSPATFARYAWTTGGAIYGAGVGQWQPPIKSPVEGLVLAGAGVFPGAGVEAVVISGTLAADAICPVTREQSARTPVTVEISRIDANATRSSVAPGSWASMPWRRIALCLHRAEETLWPRAEQTQDGQPRALGAGRGSAPPRRLHSVADMPEPPDGRLLRQIVPGAGTLCRPAPLHHAHGQHPSRFRESGHL
jgi:hypothetical protein